MCTSYYLLLQSIHAIYVIVDQIIDAHTHDEALKRFVEGLVSHYMDSRCLKKPAFGL